MIVLAVVILLGASYFMLSRFSLQTNQSTSTNYNKNSKTKVKGSHVAPMMVFIPGGTFEMGRNDGPPQETPAHSVTVKDFFIDNTEVTNAEYAEFVRNTNYAFPTDWVGSAPAYGTEQWPVVNVSLNDTMAFAFWRSTRDLVSYRLPTEEEWEYAARNGAKADLFPWGNTWVSDRAVFGLSAPQDVGSLPNGMNHWGAVDLIGNVWEWTSSRASVYQGNTIVFPGKFKDWYVIRGGSYQSQLSAERPITATYRDWLVPSTKSPALGFRLVRSTP
jgi:formylglycine-generating enzyme required for sulfatase activity